jgi:hypothetical protein
MSWRKPLSLRQKYLGIVSKLMTPGAIGMAVLLGSAAPGAASQDPAGPLAPGERVSERLAAIRDAVSAVSGAEARPAEAAAERRLAWHNWGNGGWGGGGGFGFGRPWGNFSFGVPWNNWNNWRNGWNNWRNGWGNW